MSSSTGRQVHYAIARITAIFPDEWQIISIRSWTNDIVNQRICYLDMTFQQNGLFIPSYTWTPKMAFAVHTTWRLRIPEFFSALYNSWSYIKHLMNVQILVMHLEPQNRRTHLITKTSWSMKSKNQRLTFFSPKLLHVWYHKPNLTVIIAKAQRR